MTVWEGVQIRTRRGESVAYAKSSSDPLNRAMETCPSDWAGTKLSGPIAASWAFPGAQGQMSLFSEMSSSWKIPPKMQQKPCQYKDLVRIGLRVNYLQPAGHPECRRNNYVLRYNMLGLINWNMYWFIAIVLKAFLVQFNLQNFLT